jgi:hypothetical protein
MLRRARRSPEGGLRPGALVGAAIGVCIIARFVWRRVRRGRKGTENDKVELDGQIESDDGKRIPQGPVVSERDWQALEGVSSQSSAGELSTREVQSKVKVAEASFNCDAAEVARFLFDPNSRFSDLWEQERRYSEIHKSAWRSQKTATGTQSRWDLLHQPLLD